MWERAIALAQQAGTPEAAAIYTAAAAVCEAHSGNRAAAKERAHAALQLAKNRDVEYAAAFALALSGESESLKVAAELEKRFPEDTPVQSEYLPTLRALSALLRNAPLDAVERLQPAMPYDYATPGTAFYGNSEASTPYISVDRRTWEPDVAKRLRLNFKRSSVTAA